MQLVPSDDVPEQFVERARAAVSAHRRLLLARAPVIGVAAPDLGDGRLLSSETGGDGLLVTLGYGDAQSAGGPFVSVTTAAGESGRGTIQDALADERDRLFDHAGVDEPEPTDLRTEPGLLRIDGYGLPTRIHREDTLWATQARLPGELAPSGTQPGEDAFVVVVSRGVAPDALRLTPVHDVAALLAAHDEWLAAEAERFAMRPEPEPLALPGIDAHRRLAAMALADVEARRSELAAGREPRRRHPRRPNDLWERVWEAALDAQIRLAGQRHDEANRSVAMMVNQLTSLAETMPWWPRHAEAATEETIRFVIFDSEVPSVAAQRLWASRFTAIRPAADGQWRTAWEQWREARER